MMVTKSNRRGGFTLVELLVVIGIIALLIAMLLPALQKAQAQAKWIKCQSNLRSVGGYLMMYGNQWRGFCYPPGLGAGEPPERRWPVHVFKPAVYNPPVMICPSDYEPMFEHSYIINDHIHKNGMKFGSKPPRGLSSSDIVLMGEKVTSANDYYMNEVNGTQTDFDLGKIELYRHGLRVGSNYLYMDMHVGSFRKVSQLRSAADPWDWLPESVAANPQ